ncbi:YqiJ family protein [Kordiimonas laminariae]|uniref:YqiJ family protein n=1 Tax=Kordiimonas laminariae TaxID=2917717 RepID=UPI001FF5DAB9|nr:YqiJ family protein [Kordiimonas laminariae]MCK0068078.1 YqiJ family protein [Kordiimonas laminariae]
MIDFVLQAENLPFAVALALLVLIGLIEGVGMLLGFAVSGLLDNLFPDADLDMDADIGDHGAFGELLTWLRVKEVPVIAILIAFLTSFSIVGFAIQQVLFSITSWMLPAVVAAVIAVFASLPGVRLFAGVLAKIMPRDETSAISRNEFIGHTATITLGVAATGSPAEAKFRDKHGTTHYLMVEPDNKGEEFSQGSDVLIVREEGARFFAIPAEK